MQQELKWLCILQLVTALPTALLSLTVMGSIAKQA